MWSRCSCSSPTGGISLLRLVVIFSCCYLFMSVVTTAAAVLYVILPLECSIIHDLTVGMLPLPPKQVKKKRKKTVHGGYGGSGMGPRFRLRSEKWFLCKDATVAAGAPVELFRNWYLLLLYILMFEEVCCLCKRKTKLSCVHKQHDPKGFNCDLLGRREQATMSGDSSLAFV